MKNIRKNKSIKSKFIVITTSLFIGLLFSPIQAAQKIGQMDFENNLNDPYGFLYSGYPSLSYVSGHTNLAARSAHNADDCEYTSNSFCIGTGSSRWDSGELYIRFWVKYEAEYVNRSNNVKWLWTYGADAHNEIALDTGCATVHWQLNGGGAGWSKYITKYSSNFGDIRGKWTKVEIYFKLSSGENRLNSDGIQWIKINDDYVIYEDDVKTGTPGTLSAPSINGTIDQETGHGWWQIDDYEVWDGIPYSGNPPAAPTGLQLVE